MNMWYHLSCAAGPEVAFDTRELLTLADWLISSGCTHVAIESTGDYWKPVFNILEGTFELLLVNAQHVKAVPGRKTDVKDAAWLAEPCSMACCTPALFRRWLSGNCGM
jgi:transposase